MSSHTVFSRGFARAVLIAVIAVAAAAPSAFAQSAADDRETLSIKVQYSDLNLATAEGSRTLYHRLVDAAERVCPRAGNLRDLRQNRAAQRCIDSAVQEAVKHVSHPQLAQIAASHLR